jgi:hypothetical protein
MDDKLEKLARSIALENLNQKRKEAGKPPLTCISRLWWDMYKREWLKRAKAQMEKK